MSSHSEACCKIPPVVADDYSAKGEYVTLNGTRTYVTGPKDADTAIFFAYDIFGYTPQTLQGADILAYGGLDKKYQVFVPDFFAGSPAELEWYLSSKEEDQKKLGEWFAPNAPAKHLPRVAGLTTAAQDYNGALTSWGIIGYCWGGKLASLIAGQRSLFKAAVQTSPAMIDPADAEQVTIPTCVLASKDEPADDVKRYGDKLTVPKHVEIFGDSVHGWMSARADLKDSKAKAEYERGYQIALSWFHEHL